MTKEYLLKVAVSLHISMNPVLIANTMRLGKNYTHHVRKTALVCNNVLSLYNVTKHSLNMFPPTLDARNY